MKSKDPALPLSLLLIGLLGALAYLPSLWNGFVFDDILQIERNFRIRSLTEALWYFTNPPSPGDLFRPVTFLTYALNYSISGYNPFSYHLLNLLLHAANSILVCIFLARLFDSKGAILAGIIFAVLPIHTEAVANIVGRAELLSTGFILGALILLIRPRLSSIALTESLAIVLLPLLAYLSKESSLTALLLAPLALWHQRGAGVRTVGFVRALILLSIPAAVMLALRCNAIGAIASPPGSIAFLDNPISNLPFDERALNGLALLGRYFVLSIFPLVLRADYSYNQIPQLTFHHLDTVLYLAMAALLLIAGVIGVMRRRNFGFLIAWFFLAFSITSNILLPIGTIFGERLAYLPSIGVCGLLALALAAIQPQRTAMIALFMLAAVYGFVSARHSIIWRSNESLFSETVIVSPNSAKTQLNYGTILRKQKMYQRALKHLNKAVEIYPKYAGAVSMIGFVYGEMANQEQAINWYNRALAIDPLDLPTNVRLAQILLNAGKLDEAEHHLKQALTRDATDFEAQLGMAALAYVRGDMKGATKILDHLEKIEPNDVNLKALRESVNSAKSPPAEPANGESYE